MPPPGVRGVRPGPGPKLLRLRSRGRTAATSASSGGGPNTPPPLEPVTGDIWLPMGSVARVVMTGRDGDELLRGLESQHFEVCGVVGTGPSGSRGQCFRVEQDDPPSAGSCRLVPVYPGSAGLAVAADGAPGSPVVALTDLLTVRVYSVATQVLFFYKVSGTDHEVAINVSAVTVPINRTATIRMEGRDALGNVVPLQDQQFTGGGFFHFVPTDPPLADSVVMVPDFVGTGVFGWSADGDPSPGASPMSGNVAFDIRVSWATHLAEEYTLVDP